MKANLPQRLLLSFITSLEPVRHKITTQEAQKPALIFFHFWEGKRKINISKKPLALARLKCNKFVTHSWLDQENSKWWNGNEERWGELTSILLIMWCWWGRGYDIWTIPSSLAINGNKISFRSNLSLILDSLLALFLYLKYCEMEHLF